MNHITKTLFVLFIVCGCAEDDGIDHDCVERSIGLYPDQQTSAYILPYMPGESYKVGKGNCAAQDSHLEGTSGQFSYDFIMPIGATIVATRGGTVLAVEDSFADSTRIKGEDNFIVIKHEDDSLAVYGHLTIQGAYVAEGDNIAQGQPIGLSGDSGGSTAPHLHFHVQTACENDECINNLPLPITFKNTRAHPNGLVQGQSYMAEPW